MQSKTPRGIRNNNPLNIRIGNTWLGETPNPTDSEFEQFCAVQYGLRAGFVILRRYIRRYGRNTIAKIINAWAPSSENNTQAYIDAVCKRTGIPQDTILSYEDEQQMVALVEAMAFVECHQIVDTKIIFQSYQMA